jgi:hypothetical protein
MPNDVIWNVLSSKNKSVASYPRPEGELEDILNFGVSFIEHEDHISEYIVADPKMTKRMIKEIEEFRLCCDGQPYIGRLWTSKVYITEKIKGPSLYFSNVDFSVVLHLHLNNIK